MIAASGWASAVSTHLVDSGKHALSGCCADLDGMGPIGQDLRLHNGHQAVLLADACIARQPIRILMDGLHAKNYFEFQHTMHSSPFTALLIEAGDGITVAGRSSLSIFCYCFMSCHRTIAHAGQLAAYFVQRQPIHQHVLTHEMCTQVLLG